MGRVTRFKFREFRDAVTGTRITRLTPPGCNALRNYFYQKAFTNNGHQMLLGTDLGGTLNFWLLDLTNGEARQLTSGEHENIQGAYLSADDRFLYFTRDNRFHCRVDLESLDEKTVYEVPEGWVGYGTWGPNSACTHTAAMLMKAEDRVTGTGWDRFARQYEVQPRQRLIEIDLATGADRVVYEVKQHLGHPMFRPFHDEQLGFCLEGPHDLVESRIWLIGRDGTGLRKVKTHAPGESVMHEFWVPDGSRLLYVSYTKGEKNRSIWSVNPDTLENTRLMDMPPCAHLMSNAAGTVLVGDGAGQLGDVADKAAHALVPDPNLYLFDLATLTYRPLCGHHSSWAVWRGNTQATHPHPSFTPDGTRVLFASDFEGELALYLAEVR